MFTSRRSLLTGALGAAAATASVVAANAGPRKTVTEPAAGAHALLPETDAADDATSHLQTLIDRAAVEGRPVLLPAGTLRTGPLTLHPGTALIGANGLTTLEFTGGPAFLIANNAANLRIENLVLGGASRALNADDDAALIRLTDCPNVKISNVTVSRSLANGIALTRCSGRIADCTISNVLLAAIRSLDAAGLDIAHNEITDCRNNGIQVWRSAPGEDGTLITANRIARIESKGGGTGQNGNGVNVFRAANVIVSGNRITDCAYSAVRGNAASNIQILANNAQRIGEVALYAEFGFEGAIIANNLVDGAATGISVTNFNEGGRLAVVEGNLIRNLHRREHEPVDKRGEGISIEADTLVSGNVIENAPTCGIMVGWGRYMRNALVTQNLIRDAATGILISSDAEAGACLVSSNMITGAKNGAIRAMTNGQPQGPDLATLPTEPGARVSVSANLVS
jgi:uncharacterized secreted repeat protein (TIGR03808 family)